MNPVVAELQEGGCANSRAYPQNDTNENNSHPVGLVRLLRQPGGFRYGKPFSLLFLFEAVGDPRFHEFGYEVIEFCLSILFCRKKIVVFILHMGGRNNTAPVVFCSTVQFLNLLLRGFYIRSNTRILCRQGDICRIVRSTAL